MDSDLLALHEDYVDAELRADAARLGELLAEDFASIGERGYVLTKQQWIGKFTDLSYTALTTSDLDGRRHGPTAIVRGIQHSASIWNGTAMTLTTRFSQVWVNLFGAGWRLVALQFSSLDPALLPAETFPGRRLLPEGDQSPAEELSRPTATSPDADDRLAIHEVIARHGHLVDEGALADLDTVFTADVIYDLTPVGGGILTGVEAVTQAALAMGDRNPVGHHVTNVRVNALDGSRATAASKAIAVMADGTTGSAVYEDELVHGTDGWRISRRTVRLRRQPLSPSTGAPGDEGP